MEFGVSDSLMTGTCYLLTYTLLAGVPAPKFSLSQLQPHFPSSLEDHLSLFLPCLAWHLPLLQGCPHWVDRGQASQLGNVHVVAT